MPGTLTTLLPRLTGLLDAQTRAHSCRVAHLGVGLAQVLELGPVSTHLLYLGGLLHDIGKGLIPAELLDKPGRLLPWERRVVENHAPVGAQLLLAAVPNVEPAVIDIVRHHHERLDGSGYPDGLRGDAISLPVRVIAVADMYDALTNDRPYRPALSRREALAFLEHEARYGRLDAAVVAALRRVRAAAPDTRAVVETGR